jgi:hypothetical protein
MTKIEWTFESGRRNMDGETSLISDVAEHHRPRGGSHSSSSTMTRGGRESSSGFEIVRWVLEQRNRRQGAR